MFASKALKQAREIAKTYRFDYMFRPYNTDTLDQILLNMVESVDRLKEARDKARQELAAYKVKETTDSKLVQAFMVRVRDVTHNKGHTPDDLIQELEDQTNYQMSLEDDLETIRDLVKE